MTPSKAERPCLLWVSPELKPHATAGGLGEVVGVLGQELHAAGWPIAVLIPRYRAFAEAETLVFHDRHEMTLQLGGHVQDVAIQEAETAQGLRLLLLDCPALYDREGIYGATPAENYGDNALRFGLLGLAACEIIRRGIWAADILHMHDWPASLSVVLLASWYRELSELAKVWTILSIHNLAHAGVFDLGSLDELSLPRGLGLDEAMGFAGGVSWLKGAVRYADRVLTVSPAYAREIHTPELGCGLDDALRDRGAELRGILNGLDGGEWNPRTDPLLAANYSSRSLAPKAKCRDALRSEFGLQRSTAPLFVFGGRLVEQKGVKLVLELLPSLLSKGAQFVCCGSGQWELEQGLLALREQFPRQVGLHIGFDRDLMHRLMAGGDILLMPSRFEPCGITQMQAMSYGTVPVVHGVGGLRDTVVAVTPASLAKARGTGFVFRSFTQRAFATAVGRAWKAFADRKTWQGIQRRGMEVDWSWPARLAEYEREYRRTLKAPPRRFQMEIPRLQPEKAAEPQTTYIDWGPDLPSRYGEDTVRLMVQAPRQLYVYWEVSAERWAGVEQPVRLELEGEDGSSVVAASVGDVGEWWPAGLPDQQYRVVLRDASGSALLTSNSVRTPREVESLRHDVQWVELERRRRRWVERAGERQIVTEPPSERVYPRPARTETKP